MKVLHVIPSYYPAFRYGGPLQSTFLLNQYLTKAGVEVDVLTTTAGQEPSFVLAASRGWQQVDNHRVLYLPYRGYEHYNFSVPFYKKCKELISQYDLIHITGVWNFTTWAAAFWACRYQKKYLISPRGVLYPEAFRLRSYLIKKMYYHLFTRRYMHHADLLHYTTHDEQEHSNAHLSIRTPSVVIPNGIDMHTVCADGREIKDLHRPYLLYVGRLHRIKSLELLITAFHEINNPDFHLYIAGDYNTEYGRLMQNLVEKRGMQQQIHFTGAVYDERKWFLYRHAYLFVLPSRSENFGMSVVEAMACGCPVVISDRVGIHREVAAHQAGVVHQLTLNSLKEALLTFMRDCYLRDCYAANARRLVEEEYEIGKVSERMKKIYEELLS
ncbi:glycosyltransferase involved in cell wall biosynthesis [Thermoflavifilum aggregans]|uniref:Glycosyltransferase involved in cell wall biosynthesis n=1 Tax=Thermoflavifilum aggregans TaxID=454188 RepID=A0A2M9CS14_9BACT|nr:glycosyltransferase [Thermoflavifilum aggregans]PJJ74687.1 glycosyltransferase involved in cell wall biosynthesis [Thermoflavifilum aggregans]